MTLQSEIPALNTFTTLGEAVANLVLDVLRLASIRCGSRNMSQEIMALDDRNLADIGLRPSDRTDVSVREAVSQTLDHIVSVGGFPFR